MTDQGDFVNKYGISASFADNTAIGEWASNRRRNRPSGDTDRGAEPR